MKTASGHYRAKFNKMLFYLLLIAVTPFHITAYQQNSDDASMEMAQVYGKNFDSVMASEKFNAEQKSSKKHVGCQNQCDQMFQRCMANCPMTLDINPVCGTDNVTYDNRSELCCARKCGKDVRIKHYGACSTECKTG